jgi:hypothetical protein
MGNSFLRLFLFFLPLSFFFSLPSCLLSFFPSSFGPFFLFSFFFFLSFLYKTKEYSRFIDCLLALKSDGFYYFLCLFLHGTFCTSVRITAFHNALFFFYQICFTLVCFCVLFLLPDNSIPLFSVFHFFSFSSFFLFFKVLDQEDLMRKVSHIYNTQFTAIITYFT